MNYTKDIFDYRDLSPEIKKRLCLDSLESDVFREKIYNLFDIAKSMNINKLNETQIAVAYCRTYTSKDSSDIKTVKQIRSKLSSIVQCDNEYMKRHPDSNMKVLKRLADEKCYTID